MLTAGIKQQIWKVDSQLPITRVKTMDEVAASSFAARSFNMLLLTIFAGLALVLAAVGIYGVMSYAVTQRTQEIGIRMALGARSARCAALIIRHGMTMTLIGVALGVGGAYCPHAGDGNAAVRSNADRQGDLCRRLAWS